MLIYVNETKENPQITSAMSVYDRIARISLIIPWASVPAVFAILYFLGENALRRNSKLIGGILAGEFVVLLITLIFGFFGLFKSDHHKRTNSWWIALLGILSNIGWGFIVGICTLLSQFHDC